MLLTSGIARPQSFRQVLELLGGEIAGELSFADHHSYDSTSIRKMLKLREQTEHDFWVATEKDMTRLKAFPELAEYLWIVEMTVDPDSEWEDYFRDFLLRLPKPIPAESSNS